MKENKEDKQGLEFLSAIGNVDEKLAEQAFMTYTKEKFDKLHHKRSKNITMKLTAIAATLLIVFGLIGFLPLVNPMFKSEEVEGKYWEEYGHPKKEKDENVVPENYPQSEGKLIIQSGDMWNYYAAVKAIFYSNDPTLSHKGVIILNNDTGYDKQPYESERPNPPETDYPADTYLPESGYREVGSGEVSLPNIGDNVYYYDLSEFGELNIIRATHLRAVLKEEKGFLASKIGTGEIEIVITEISGFDSMITFRNGDRYFSCLENGLNDFSSHKYIEGFYVVKNEDAEFSKFLLTFSKTGDITKISCDVRNSKDHVSDVIEVIKDTQRSSNVKAGYSIKELEDYFNSKKET